MSKLKPGDLVYRVDEDVIEEDWRIYSVEVKTASDRRIELVRPFPFKSRTRFKPEELDHVIFSSAETAIAHFIKVQRSRIAMAERQLANATKGLRWAREVSNVEVIDAQS